MLRKYKSSLSSFHGAGAGLMGSLVVEDAIDVRPALVRRCIIESSYSRAERIRMP